MRRAMVFSVAAGASELPGGIHASGDRGAGGGDQDFGIDIVCPQRGGGVDPRVMALQAQLRLAGLGKGTVDCVMKPLGDRLIAGGMATRASIGLFSTSQELRMG